MAKKGGPGRQNPEIGPKSPSGTGKIAKIEKSYVKTGSKNAKNRVFQKSGFSHLGGVWGSKNGGAWGPK